MRTICIAALVALTGLVSFAQVSQELRQEANNYYQAGEWEKAATAYDKIVRAEDANVNARYRRASALINANKNSDAIPHLEKVLSTAPNPVYALTLARAYARSGDKVKTFATLERSLKFGGIAPETLTTEKDFAAWRDDASFKDLVHRSDLAVHPCAASPEFRQFDFWIGDWDVKTPQGSPAGSSSVQLILGQCIIFENWTAGAGGQGKSFNIFDRSDNKWHQTWVSDRGVFTHYIGGLVDGEMVITADTMQGTKKVLQRMTYSKQPNGDVRQHGEASSDDGKTWSTTFDLFYSRKK